MLREIEAEAARQERSLSWLMQQAWKIAAKRIHENYIAPDHGI
jgi:uncharacterized small protein (TIGR04563 family)